jgi:hypothetical protein
MVAAGAQKAGFKVICAGLADSVSDDLAQCVDTFYHVPLARPGAWVRKLKRHGVSKTIMVGRVAKTKLFTPGRILHYLPDLRALKIYYWTLRKADKRNDTLLGAIANCLARDGIILEDSTMYCKDQMADQNTMTKHKPTSGVEGDIDFGWSIVKEMGRLDIGQAIAVKEREVIAVEAIEGTAQMIKRAGILCKRGNWTLIKVAKPTQDMRFDVPCIGPDTVTDAQTNGARCIVVEAEKTIIIDKVKTLALADKLGIAIVGRKMD